MTAEIAFRIIGSMVTDEAVESVETLLHALRMNGQICGRESPIARLDDEIKCYVNILEEISLGEVHNSAYVTEAIEHLSHHGLAKPSIYILDTTGETEVCRCSERESLILYTTFYSLEPPLRCGHCFVPVPLYRIPPTASGEYSDIIAWMSDYQACGRLYMNSNTAVRRALRELTRVDSDLSRLGIEICRTIAALTGNRAYYHLDPGERRGRKGRLVLACPSCGGDWHREEPWLDRFDLVCERCCIVSSTA